jgi:hypothetical protein
MFIRRGSILKRVTPHGLSVVWLRFEPGCAIHFVGEVDPDPFSVDFITPQQAMLWCAQTSRRGHNC